MPHAFISYSTNNQAAADFIRRVLQNNRIDTWMAPGDIQPGETYAGAINHAIKNCACFVLLLSNYAQSSTWVPKELERAVHYRKTVVPIQLEDVVLNDEFEFYISTNQAISLYTLDEASVEIQRILAAVSRCMTPAVPQKNMNTEPTPPSLKARTVQRKNCIYHGEFSENELTGEGECLFHSGERHIGNFVNGLLHGTGEILYPNGDRYVGEFSEGKMNGRGEYIWNSGNRYVGDMKHGFFHGKGQYFYANGDLYCGEFTNNKRNGKGEYVYVDGTRFVGTYCDDQRVSGTMYDKNGTVIQQI